MKITIKTVYKSSQQYLLKTTMNEIACNTGINILNIFNN